MYEYKAKVVRIIDADTIEFAIDLGFHKRRWFDYDTQEWVLESD